jgi:hypothetical protein
MADIESPLTGDHFPETFQRLASNLFTTEKSLIKLRQALPVEKQEEFTNQIQSLSKQRLILMNSIKAQEQFNTEDNFKSVTLVQEAFNACLNNMISEIVEETETLDYKEHENLQQIMRKKKLSTKGMIVGNFYEVAETMDRILELGETLIIQGYQKLFIDSGSMKEKLQSVIDERKNLPTCSKPLDTLILKQQFSEKQLRCMMSLLDEANTLSDLIVKLQEFDKRQIQFTQSSQITTDAMKKFFYNPEIRKTSERRRTYLSVSYADPSNPKEGLDILRDQLNSVVWNLNLLCDMEDAKVRTVKKSDLGDVCEAAYEDALKLFEEEKEILKKTLAILVAIEDNQVDLENCDKFLEDFKLPEEVPQNQLEYIKFFVQVGLSAFKIRVQQARLFNDLVSRFDQDHTVYSSLVDKLQSEVNDLVAENNDLKSQVQGRVIEKITEGTYSLKEIIELQDHLKTSIQDSLEGQLKKQITEALLLSSGIGDILLGINPDEDMKIRVIEFDSDYNRATNLNDLAELLTKYQTWIFKLVSKLAKFNDVHTNSNVSNLKRSKNLQEVRDNLVGKPSEYPLASMDRVLSEIIKSYLSGLDERKGNIDSVIQKQSTLVKLLKDYKSQ